jgi:NTP pyrophosphatase (non-canonical NTP hydrolase)
MELKNLIENVVQWGKERGLHETTEPRTQILYAISEMGELAKAIAKNNRNETIDAIGDIIVCLINAMTVEKYDNLEYIILDKN